MNLYGDQRYTDDIPTDATGTRVVKSRTTWDVGLVLDLRQLPTLGPLLPMKHFYFSVVATNVSDESVRDALFYPQPGRVVTFRVETTW